MSDGIRVPLEAARDVAAELVALLAPACERIEVAGSIRRGAPDVGDVELVAVPKLSWATEPDGLFTTRTVERDLLRLAIADAMDAAILAPHPTDAKAGERYAKLMHVPTGLQVDLFAVRPPAQWGVIFLIRTGPADYSQWLVTTARRRGYHVAGGALHRGSMSCGALPCEVMATPEEGDVHRILQVEPLPPERRGRLAA